MISGIVPFEEIVQAVKDETGIENIRPFYEKIRRLIFRGEREIGYGGSVVLMKKTYHVAGITNSNPNFGKYFVFPEDFIEFEGVGQDCKKITENKYLISSEGMRFHKKQDKDIVLLYWGLGVDEHGYPMVTRNHEEAVIAYIVWKLYSPKIFLGIGNMNAKDDYKQAFTMALLEARGDDAFPTLEQWNAIGQLSYTDRRTLIDQPVHSYDYCAEYEDEIDESEPDLTKNVKFWQLGLGDTIEALIPLVNPAFLFEKEGVPLEQFEDGHEVDFISIGKICYAITETDDDYYVFKDFMNNVVDSAFDVHYFEDLRVKLYVSKNTISHTKIIFKIQTP